MMGSPLRAHVYKQGLHLFFFVNARGSDFSAQSQVRDLELMVELMEGLAPNESEIDKAHQGSEPASRDTESEIDKAHQGSEPASRENSSVSWQGSCEKLYGASSSSDPNPSVRYRFCVEPSSDKTHVLSLAQLWEIPGLVQFTKSRSAFDDVVHLTTCMLYWYIQNMYMEKHSTRTEHLPQESRSFKNWRLPNFPVGYSMLPASVSGYQRNQNKRVRQEILRGRAASLRGYRGDSRVQNLQQKVTILVLCNS
ncbi:hypothetical protein RRG08_045520 [Elysia crispata]|uniref:Uncharacterized protein n=1 Tax=Elysia crispata TaxID=231223 RepID=A0AAE1CXA0_9GAST|nr:hypothetical protein RRG08_045520 [Elysia crispata]